MPSTVSIEEKPAKLFQDMDDDGVEDEIIGASLGHVCFGMAFQMSGALECLVYMVGKTICCMRRDHARERTVAYYLDIWSLMILGTLSIGSIVGLVIRR